MRLGTTPTELAVFAALSLTARTAHAADPYEDAMARATQASGRGDHAGAARALEPAVAAYSQDYAVAVECAWQYFQAAQWEAAERTYREALSRAPESNDARVGLAWTLVRETRCEDAVAEAKKTTDPRAKDVLAACTPASRWTLSASFLGTLAPSHPIKRTAAGALVSATAPIGEDGVVGAAWRFVHVGTTATSGVAAFDQHDGYFHVGSWGERYGLLFRGALVSDGSGALGTSAHAGFSAHFRLASLLPPWTGDLRLESSVSIYDDGALVRVAPSWAIHAVGPLHLIPGVAFQYGGGEAFASGSLTALLQWPTLSLWAGAKYGDEKRPAYLAQSVVYDITERVAWGAWVGVRVQPWKALGFEATWAFDELRRTDSLTPAESGMHSFTIGPVVSF